MIDVETGVRAKQLLCIPVSLPDMADHVAGVLTLTNSANGECAPRSRRGPS